jgi:hypothetical protein
VKLPHPGAVEAPRLPARSGHAARSSLREERPVSIQRCACGGGCPRCREEAKRAGILPKLAVSEPGDAVEREADRIAARALTAPSLVPGGAERPEVLPAPRPAGGSSLGISETGAPLPGAARSFFEPRLGRDLGDVRVHAGSEAAKLADSFDARAFTVGSDLFFAEGEMQPETAGGRALLAHELAHVVQQDRRGPGDRLVQRTQQVTFTTGKGKKKRTMTVVVGNVEFSKNAKADVLKSGGLLPGADQAHIAFHGNLLAYDVAYTTPEDPFRWDKIKDLIDSDEKIKVDKVELTDNVKVKFVTPKATMIIDQLMMQTAAAGLTLPTETLFKAIYPTETTYTCSPHTDAHQIYYTAVMSSSVSRSELAHELLGHMWLAIKKVPFVHPRGAAKVKAMGTLSASHGIKDPLGKTFTGKVEDYISNLVSSQIFAAFASPTQFVSPAFFTQALADFKTELAKGATKNKDGSWAISNAAGLAWEKLSNNYRFADPGTTSGTGGAGAGKTTTTTPTTLTQASVVKDLTTWYATLTADQQYVLVQMLQDIKGSIDRITDLAVALLKVVKP